MYNLFQERSRDEREVRLSKQEGAKLGVVRVIIKRAVSMLVVGVCVDHLVREQDDRLREVTDPNFEKARSSSLTWSSWYEDDCGKKATHKGVVSQAEVGESLGTG